MICLNFNFYKNKINQNDLFSQNVNCILPSVNNFDGSLSMLQLLMPSNFRGIVLSDALVREQNALSSIRVNFFEFDKSISYGKTRN